MSNSARVLSSASRWRTAGRGRTGKRAAQRPSITKAHALFKRREKVAWGTAEARKGSPPKTARPSAKQGSKATRVKTIIHKVKRVEARNPGASLSAAQAKAVNSRPCQMLAISISAGLVEMNCRNRFASIGLFRHSLYQRPVSSACWIASLRRCNSSAVISLSPRRDSISFSRESPKKRRSTSRTSEKPASSSATRGT